MKPLRALCGACLLALALASLAGAAAGPAVHLTAAGNAAARSSLLTAKLMGKGWKAATPRTFGLDLACPGYAPSGAGIVEVGAAFQPDLDGGTAGPIVTQMTGVFATAAQTSTLWRRVVTPRLITCAREGLEGVTRKGIRTHVLSQGALSVPEAPPKTAAYRVVADLISKTQTLKTYFDVILVIRGRTISELTIATFIDPVTPADAEGALAALVYSKMR